MRKKMEDFKKRALKNLKKIRVVEMDQLIQIKLKGRKGGMDIKTLY